MPKPRTITVKQNKAASVPAQDGVLETSDPRVALQFAHDEANRVLAHDQRSKQALQGVLFACHVFAGGSATPADLENSARLVRNGLNVFAEVARAEWFAVARATLQAVATQVI
jgi:hypothetical protein